MHELIPHEQTHRDQSAENARRARAAAATQRSAQSHDVDWDHAIALLHKTLRCVYRHTR